MGRLDGKVAIVSGGCSGIGAGIVKRFVEEGASVHVLDLIPADGAPVAGAEYIEGDVADASDWDRTVARAGGRIDVLVNNAGIANWESVTELDEENWQRVVDVDQKGVWLGMKAVIPGMIEAGGGAIVNMCSICGVVSRPGLFVYHTSKGAVLMMTRNAAVTYAPDAVRVNAISPGFISTPGTDIQDPAISQEFIDATPLGHPGEPVDIANAALFLASDEARFVTGANFAVDGGYLAQ